MLNQDITPAVERAFQLSQKLAQHLRSDVIEPIHVIRGLLQEDEGKAFALLVEANLSAEQVKAFADSIPNVDEEAAEKPLANSTLHCVRGARNLARELEFERTIQSEHLLMAILQVDQSIRTELISLGLNIKHLESILFEALAGPGLPLDEPLELEDVTADRDTMRILDANANRAREALRVLEDFCRFVWDDAFLSREWKTLRHDLGELLQSLGIRESLLARETLQDVGTSISTGSELARSSLQDVLQANCKRLQEALRSLEEYGKIHTPAISSRLEQLRYKSYTLERTVILGWDARSRLSGVRLYALVTGSQCWGPLEQTVYELMEGGVQAIQMREKHLNDRELIDRAKVLRRWTREQGVLFIVNDRPDIARLSEADGVHIGQEELPVREVRRLLGNDALVGVSTHNLPQVQQAVCDGADYIGVGPTFPSETKTFEEYPGLSFVSRVQKETTLPAFVIGGITLSRLPEVLAAGGKRVAVSSALCGSETPEANAKAMRDLLDAAGSTI